VTSVSNLPISEQTPSKQETTKQRSSIPELKQHSLARKQQKDTEETLGNEGDEKMEERVINEAQLQTCSKKAEVKPKKTVRWELGSEGEVENGVEDGDRGAAIIEITVGKERLWVLADSGATKSLVSERFANDLELNITPVKDGKTFRSAGNNVLQVIGETKMGFRIGKLALRERFYVTRNLTQDVILGGDFFWKHKVDLLFSTDQLQVGSERVDMIGSKKPIISSISEDVEPGEKVNLDRTNMTEAQIEELKELINEYSDIFSKCSEDIGESEFTHRIELTSQEPVKKKAYRIPYAQQKIVEDEVDKMLKANIIRKAHSPYGSPVVLVKKRDNSVRFCVDYRELNTITVKDNFPMPFIDEKLESFLGKDFFSSLDLTSGYWQFMMEEECRRYTAFVTHKGSYEFNRMPFGLCNAGATFQRAMEELLEDLEYAMAYIDDVMVSSTGFDDHLKHLRKVFGILREKKLKMKPTKCHFGFRETKFLGFIVSAEGMKVCPSRSETIANYPRPTTAKGVRSFLGLASYYRRFIPGFSDIASSMIALTRKNKSFVWDEKCEEGFNQLKKCLIEPPILSYPDLSKQFYLTTDASNVGLGAVLSQYWEGEERVIAYASRTLQPAEKNYSTTELELLAIVWAVKRFRPYLYGKEFKLITDHKPLIHLNTSMSTSSRLQRWKLALSEYNYTIEYKKGSENINADALSRIEYAASMEEVENRVSDEEMIKRQAEDPEVNALRKKVEGDGGAKKGLIMEGGLLYCLKKFNKPYEKEGTKRIVIPESMIESVLECCHDSMCGAHLGVRKTICQVAVCFYWPGLKEDVVQWIKSCKVCAARKAPFRQKAPLHSITHPRRPFDLIGIDFVGPLRETDEGNKYLIVITDYVTKWVEAFPTKDAKATTVARILVDQIISRHGAPREILSDQGQAFLAKLVYQVCEYFRIKKLNTTAYHPQTNGLTEKFNGTLCGMLAVFCDQYQVDWDEFVPVVLFAYRTSEHRVTKESPFRALYGREASLPADMDRFSTKQSFVERIDEVWKESVRLIKEEADKSEKNRPGRGAKLFEIGDKVRVEAPATKVGLKKKLRKDLWTGPFVVINRNENSNVEVLIDGKSKWIHCDRIKPAETITRFGRISKQPDRLQAGMKKK